MPRGHPLTLCVIAATARCLAGKLGAQPDRVLLALMNDRMVAKGTILQWATAFFQDFLATEPMDELVVVLRKARIDARLLELFPPQKRTVEDFDAHFKVIAFPSVSALRVRQQLIGAELAMLAQGCACCYALVPLQLPVSASSILLNDTYICAAERSMCSKAAITLDGCDQNAKSRVMKAANCMSAMLCF